jgi:hypothetical protein
MFYARVAESIGPEPQRISWPKLIALKSKDPGA